MSGFESAVVLLLYAGSMALVILWIGASRNVSPAFGFGSGAADLSDPIAVRDGLCCEQGTGPQGHQPLRGFVLCNDCGKPLTACWSKGKKQKYPYYLCPTKGCESYRKSY